MLQDALVEEDSTEKEKEETTGGPALEETVKPGSAVDGETGSQEELGGTQAVSDAKDPTGGERIEDRQGPGSEKSATGDPEVQAETVLVGLECSQLGPEDGVSARETSAERV
jgi:hypothetical protein